MTQFGMKMLHHRMSLRQCYDDSSIAFFFFSSPGNEYQTTTHVKAEAELREQQEKQWATVCVFIT